MLTFLLVSRSAAQQSKDAAAPAAGAIPREAKLSPDAGIYTAQIDAFVKAQVEKLKDKSSIVQRDAREALVAETNSVGNDPPSASFISLYAGSIGDAVRPIEQDPNMRARLNAAIVVARVAAKADNDQLKGAVEAMLADKSDPVVLWAMKGARALLPYYLRNPANTKPTLLDAMTKAVQEHHSAGVAQEAYGAASLGLLDNPNAKGITPAMLTAAITETQALLEVRLAYYVTALPEEPQSDNLATRFFALQNVWRAHTPDQQKRSMQLMCELINVDAQRAAGASVDDRRQFIEALGNAARAIQAIGLVLNDENIETTSKSLAQAIPSTPDAQVALRRDAVIGALQGNPAFKGMPSPTIQVKPVKAPVATTSGAASPAPGGAGEEDGQ